MKELAEDLLYSERVYEFLCDGERYILHAPKDIIENKERLALFKERFPQIFARKIATRTFARRRSVTGEHYDAILITVEDLEA